MNDIAERLAEHLYGHSREKAIEWAKEDKFDSCYRQAEEIIELIGAEYLLRQHLAEAQDEIDRATLYATELAISLHRKLYADVTQWEPLPELYGLLSQIDNMMCGIQTNETT